MITNKSKLERKQRSLTSEQMFRINLLKIQDQTANCNKFEFCCPILIFFTARDTNEIMLVAFILKVVNFFEEYKLRPDCTL